MLSFREKILRAPDATDDTGGGDADNPNDADFNASDYDYGEDADNNLNASDFGIDDEKKTNPDDTDDADSTIDDSVDNAARDSDDSESTSDTPIVDPRVLEMVQQTGGDEKLAAKFTYEEYKSFVDGTIRAYEEVRPNFVKNQQGDTDPSRKADEKKAEPFAFKLDPTEHDPELIKQLGAFQAEHANQIGALTQEVQTLRQALGSIAREAQSQQNHLKEQQFDSWIGSLPEYMRTDELLGTGQTSKLNGSKEAGRHRAAIKAHMDMVSEVYATKGMTPPAYETLAKQSLYAIMGEQLQKSTEKSTRKKVGDDSIKRKKSMQAPGTKSSTKIAPNDAEGYGAMDAMLGEMGLQDEESDMMAFLS